MTRVEDICTRDRGPEKGRLGSSFWANAKVPSSWVWWLPPATLALTLALIFRDPFAGDWDALDYTVLGVLGQPSSMVLGRTLFIFFNHSLWYAAHNAFALTPENAYLLFKYVVILQSPFAIIAWWRLSHGLTNSLRAATVSALLLVLSPFFIIYSGQVMTEIPSLLFVAVALTIHLSGLHTQRFIMVVFGAALLGVSVNVREAPLLYFPWLIVGPYSCGWRWNRNEIKTTIIACFAFSACAFGPFLFLFATNFGSFRFAWLDWLHATQTESSRHPINVGNFGTLIGSFFAAAPLVFLVFPLALLKELKTRGLTPVAALAVVGFVANFMLIFHYGAVVNGRYVLTGLPAVIPLVADYLVVSVQRLIANPRLAFACVIMGVILISLIASRYAWPFNRAYVENRSLAKDYRNQLAKVPHDAIMISGAQTVAVTYWRGLGMGDWNVISTGSTWPGAALNSVVARHLAGGNRVFLDADPRWWLRDTWHRQELLDLASLESGFRFRRVSGTIYEIRPHDDGTANDFPDLILQLRQQEPNMKGGLAAQLLIPRQTMELFIR